MNSRERTKVVLVPAMILIWGCLAVSRTKASSNDVLDYAIALNNAFEHRMRTGQGQMTITQITHKVDQLRGTTESQYIVDVKFIMDDRNILLDIDPKKNIVDGIEQSIRPAIICEDDRFRKEYHEEIKYAYVFDKSVIQDGDIQLRPDPRHSFRPRGLSALQLIESTKSSPTRTVEASRDGSLVTILISDTETNRRISLVLDAKLGGAITKETYFSGDEVTGNVTREFELEPGGNCVPLKVQEQSIHPRHGLLREVKYEFSQYETKDDIPGETFTFDGMGVPHGARIVDRIAGDFSYIYGGSTFISQELDKMLVATMNEPFTSAKNSTQEESSQGDVAPKTMSALNETQQENTESQDAFSVTKHIGHAKIRSYWFFVALLAVACIIIIGAILTRTRLSSDPEKAEKE